MTAAAERMSAKVTKAIAAEIGKGGQTGFVQGAFLDLLKELIPLIMGCFGSPAQAQRRVRAMDTGENYPLANYHRRVFERRIRNSGCCSWEGGHPVTEEEVADVVVSIVANLPPQEFAALVAETE